MSSFQGRALHDARNHCRGASQNHMPALPVEKLSGVSSKTTFKTMMITNDFASFGSNVFCVHSFFLKASVSAEAITMTWGSDFANCDCQKVVAYHGLFAASSSLSCRSPWAGKCFQN